MKKLNNVMLTCEVSFMAVSAHFFLFSVNLNIIDDSIMCNWIFKWSVVGLFSLLGI